MLQLPLAKRLGWNATVFEINECRSVFEDDRDSQFYSSASRKICLWNHEIGIWEAEAITCQRYRFVASGTWHQTKGAAGPHTTSSVSLAIAEPRSTGAELSPKAYCRFRIHTWEAIPNCPCRVVSGQGELWALRPLMQDPWRCPPWWFTFCLTDQLGTWSSLLAESPWYCSVRWFMKLDGDFIAVLGRREMRSCSNQRAWFVNALSIPQRIAAPQGLICRERINCTHKYANRSKSIEQASEASTSSSEENLDDTDGHQVLANTYDPKSECRRST